MAAKVARRSFWWVRERERRSRGDTYSDEVARVSNGSLAVSLGLLAARSLALSGDRFVLRIDENSLRRVRCTALGHHEAATREYSLRSVAKSHGGPKDTILITGARLSRKICSHSQGQKNTNRSLRARGSAPSLSVSLTLLVARASLALSAPVTELWYGTCIVYERRERTVRRISNYPSQFTIFYYKVTQF